VLGIPLDRFDDQVELVGAVHLARNTVEDMGFEGERFGEVVEPIDPAGGMVLHEEDGTTAVFRSREQEQMIGAEVEHGWEQTSGSRNSRPVGSAVEGFTRKTPPPGYRTERRMV
jgi:hypothetical protein